MGQRLGLEVATAAGINFGLTFRAVSENTAERFAAAPVADSALDELFRPKHQPSQYVIMLAWAILQGHDPLVLLDPHPAHNAHLERQQRIKRPVRRALTRVMGPRALTGPMRRLLIP